MGDPKMISSRRILRTRLIGGSAAIAVFSLSVFGIMAAEGQAAREHRAADVEGLSTFKNRALKCDDAGYKNTKYVFADESRQIREISMCTRENGTEAFADAQHLATELKRSSDAHRVEKPQSSGLADSHQPQAPAVNNQSAPGGDHISGPASFEGIVKTLEDELPDRPD